MNESLNEKIDSSRGVVKKRTLAWLGGWLRILMFFRCMQVIEDFAKFHMLLKLKRGEKEEKFKVEVHKKSEGTFHLNQMQQDHS